MFKKMAGFSLIETLISLQIVMVLILTILPLHQLLETERHILLDRRMALSALHDELQRHLLQAHNKKEEILLQNNKRITLTFTSENKLIKGCASWNNVKQKEEMHCLYGYR